MTPREHRALAFIESHIAQAGYPPTLTELAQHLGLATRSGAHRVLTELERQGRITRERHKDRSITVLRGTEDPGGRTVADILAAIPTAALTTEITRRQEANHG